MLIRAPPQSFRVEFGDEWWSFRSLSVDQTKRSVDKPNRLESETLKLFKYYEIVTQLLCSKMENKAREYAPWIAAVEVFNRVGPNGDTGR